MPCSPACCCASCCSCCCAAPARGQRITRLNGSRIGAGELTRRIQPPDDQELPRLLRYLLSLKDEANVRRLEKRFWRDAVDDRP
ncbi:hypothetical protein EJV47_17815 [Hymenobacter gummosus]|uniref:Uncharacterized protein n=1 Tax=Hymenobacter gummosus TaxID=1776032 RepID=A0A431TZK3_9BACT|nr:hypothetical protein [Hymenobacter gummosus]RTQ47778.1 hypothetical protein EJV47_17815 [Hymenobacter gummosus]